MGVWTIDPTDREAVDHLGDVSLDFEADGSLTYTIHTESTDQKIFLSCRGERGLLITTQPSAPREEVTEYSFDDAGRLILVFQGTRTTFVRMTE